MKYSLISCSEYEQTMDTLQADIDQLEKENVELKDKLKLMTKKSLLQNMAAGQPLTPTSASGFSQLLPSPLPGPVQDSPLLLQKIDDLQTALRIVQEQKCLLIAEKMRRAMESLPPLNVPKKPVGLATSTTGLVDLDHHTHKQHGELNQMLREVGRLQKVQNILCCF